MIKNNKTTEDICEIEATILENCMLEDLFYLKDLNDRRLYLNAEIDQFSVDDVIKHIIRINAKDKDTPVDERQPIKLFISSRGGDMDAGFELIDIIESSKTPVYTINIGYQYSMGFLIGLAGKKRFATKNSRFLMHDGSGVIYDSGAKIQDRVEFLKAVDKRIKNYVLSRSKIDETMYDSKLRVEWYMFAEEALEHGFIDEIINTAFDLDNIL